MIVNGSIIMFNARNVFLLGFSVVCLGLVGQNLVPNGDFESMIDCSMPPDLAGPEFWTVPACCAGPVHFNACYPAPFSIPIGVPSNYAGHQQALGGQGYGGLRTFQHPVGNIDQYLMIELDTALQAGVEYCVRMWASLGDSSSYQTHTLHGLFTNVPLNGCADRDSIWDNIAQVTFNTSNLDTANWSLLEASYTAVGNERWFTFGNFFDSQEILSDTSFLFLNALPYYCTFYFDDMYIGLCDVSVNEHQQPRFKIYPNPASDMVTIRFSGHNMVSNQSYVVHDAMGKLIRSGYLKGDNTMLNVSDLSPGVYRLQVTGGRAVSFVKY